MRPFLVDMPMISEALFESPRARFLSPHMNLDNQCVSSALSSISLYVLLSRF